MIKRYIPSSLQNTRPVVQELIAQTAHGSLQMIERVKTQWSKILLPLTSKSDFMKPLQDCYKIKENHKA